MISDIGAIVYFDIFIEKVYFHEWVEYRNLLDPNIPLTAKDYEHGTEVSYIIVDGPQGNPISWMYMRRQKKI